MNAPLHFTEFTSDKSNIGKRYELINGRLARDGSGQSIPYGQAERKTMTLPEFAEYLKAPAANVAIGAGLCEREITRIVTEEALPQHPGAIARLKKFFSFGEWPGIALHDWDRHADNPEGLLQVLETISPLYGTAGYVAIASNSAHIYQTETNVLLSEKCGWHLYFGVEDASDLERYGSALLKRLWLAGYGQIAISAAGTMLIRAAFDCCVFSPERLDYIAPATLGNGLEQRKPEPTHRPGELLDTRTACPDLNEAEERKYQRLVTGARAQHQDEADRIRAQWSETTWRTNSAGT